MEDILQKTAWRLVRSAQDRFREGSGQEKREWCVMQLSTQFPKDNINRLEDYVRAAYVNFKVEFNGVI
jgi:hypothetical protein